MVAAGASLVGAALLVLAGLQRVVVRGDSMLPGLSAGDRLILIPPRRLRPGAVVALTDPRRSSRILVKRVAALEGGRVTVLGDNPAASTDSRVFGAVPISAVLGRAIYRYAPAARAGRVR
jgi:nickel-type superoxide dismutase maturation protease